jgi:lipopolysaccharide heptosyltransferase II
VTTADHWRAARKVLCVRLDSMGDVLMTAPAIRAVKQAAPGRSVTLLTSSAGAEIASLVPEIDRVIAYDPPWMKSTPPRADAAPDHAMATLLASKRFDAAIIFTLHSQSPLPAAMLCYLAGVPLRMARCRENPYQLLTDWLVEDELAAPFRHDVRRQLDLAARGGFTTADERLSLGVPPVAATAVEHRLHALGIGPGDRWCVLHPGASAPSRRYPPDMFAAVARTLIAEDGYRVLVTGSAAERDLVADLAVACGPGAVPLAGDLSLGELAALIQRAPVLLSNNTGPAHIAAAVGTPVAVLYALTNPQHAPWQVPHRLLYHDVACRFCYRSVCPEGHQACLRMVDPSAVVEAVRGLAGGESPPAPAIECLTGPLARGPIPVHGHR